MQERFPNNCTSWPGCVAGTMDYHYHILLAWMTSGGSDGWEPVAVDSAKACEAQVGAAVLVEVVVVVVAAVVHSLCLLYTSPSPRDRG